MSKKPWTRGDVIALALRGCTHCYGLGLRQGRNEREHVCNCVLRKIFRAVYQKFQKCSQREGYVARVSLESAHGTNAKGSFSFKNEEFLADFLLLSRRTLGADSRQYQLFRYHYLLGADWKLCTRKLGMNRGEFFHECYRIEQTLGRAYRDTEPHGLWPLDEYFGSTFRERAARPAPLRVLAASPPDDDEDERALPLAA